MNDERLYLRRCFVEAWQKRHTPQQLSSLEKQLLELIREHKEYQNLLDSPDILEQDYRTDNNPFLHLSLHLGLHEQISTNRPTGIRDIYQQLCHRNQDRHHVQHLMMDIMADTLWHAQQNGTLPNETEYLNKLRKLI